MRPRAAKVKLTGMPHRFELRVYYEDTDLAGIVYYANYLKFIERARTEWVNSIGVDQIELKENEGLVFAVRRVEGDFLSPAKFGDNLTVSTALKEVTAARIRLAQTVERGAETLFVSSVDLVCLGENGRPRRLPAEIRHQLVG